MSYITTQQVADLLQISRRTVDRMVEHGVITPIKFGRVVRFDVDELRAQLSAPKA